MSTNNYLDVKKIPLKQLGEWTLDDNYSIQHKSKGFFTFIATQQDGFKNILISQNEIGILSILLRFEEKDFMNREILIQKKQEPGNSPLTQLSPSIQMTFSNLTGKHGGEDINLIDIQNYFRKSLYSYIRHEQSDSFLYKKNLNIFSLFDSSMKKNLFDLRNKFWIKISEIIKLALLGDSIHADTRSVLFLYFGKKLVNEFRYQFLNTINYDLANKLNLWNLSNQKNWSFIKIKDVANYKNGSLHFNCPKDKFNKRIVSGYSIKSNNREVFQWSQPLLFINKKIYDLIFTESDNQIFIIISLKSSSGTMNNLEFMPSFSFYAEDKTSNAFYDNKINLIHQSNQTEEGGRFFKRSNLHRIFYLKDISKYKDDPNKLVLSIPEILYFYENSDFISMELRSICFIFFAFLIKNKWKSQ